ncbi:alpha/beta hydrolase family protein [Planctomicrobium sp. SH668]|uniref:alpha/beta hydrolase family protein n=1 Tax=Planctomicrobium sp. SH668 TaxID=3448126 RepID=UPI003F5AEDCE
MGNGRVRWFEFLILFAICTPILAAEPSQLESTYSVSDSLLIGDEPNEDAQALLTELGWESASFDVRITPPAKADREDALIRFPSPAPMGNAINDLVALEWYQVKDLQGEILHAPAVVVIHESGSNMAVGRLIATGFRSRGIHAFLLQLPGYGERRIAGARSTDRLIERMQQGVKDARRARDVVAALEPVDASQIAIQGTSLGGFVASLAAGIDSAYQTVFLLLSGGDVYTVLKNGEREAAKIRDSLLDAQLSEDEMKAIANRVEPNRIIHRLNPKKTWLYSGIFDTVVPIENARLLASRAKLPEGHHIQMPVNHYAGIILLPNILDKMAGEIRGVTQQVVEQERYRKEESLLLKSATP